MLEAIAILLIDIFISSIAIIAGLAIAAIIQGLTYHLSNKKINLYKIIKEYIKKELKK